jgi:hypothetical protein
MVQYPLQRNRIAKEFRDAWIQPAVTLLFPATCIGINLTIDETKVDLQRFSGQKVKRHLLNGLFH